jgi:hypothetical protein
MGACREFANRYINFGLSVICGNGANLPSSAWDDWCGARRRNMQTDDQMQYFETILRTSVALGMHLSKSSIKQPYIVNILGH